MNLKPEDEAFRREVRTFLAEKLPAELAAKVRLGKTLSKQDAEGWRAVLNEYGWLAPEWPKEYGGQDWSVSQCFIW
ncbi:MAG: acyl-CoA dehydrogenase family protein, partial [Phenylobacterium sp.]|uniref:acyl-CoA dehydrogenase family protein n=1 Tax=Phenylobacterium sp. TaxID=1871053 RepID=UPI002732FA0E